MSQLHRAQIYIERGQMLQLKLEAERARLSVSELIRMAIQRLLEVKTKNVRWDKDPITKAIGSIKLSVSDASECHDRYLYAKPGKP